jgi:hypothetical protein
METGSNSSGSVEVIEVDGPDVEQDAGAYQRWVQDCPDDLLPIVRAELLARAVTARGNYPACSAVTLSMRYWADQRPSIPGRLLTDLMAAETHNSGATSADQHVRNEVTPKRASFTMAFDVTPNNGARHAHVPFAFHPFEQVQNTIVPVFTLGDRMIAWREALPPRIDDAANPPESVASAGVVALTQSPSPSSQLIK